MLSIENPPPDPSSHFQIPQLITNINTGHGENKASSDNHNLLALPEVDLLKSSLDETNPVPKFSIRNYVFGSRSKDIAKNWPFSEKNLQLCMKHGVADPLPPFQTLDSVRRNPSVKRKCSVENSFLEEEKLRHINDELSKRQNDEFVSVTSEISLGLCKQNLAALDCPYISSSGSEDVEFPSKETDSVPTDTFLESSAEKLEGETTIHQPPLKKCKLMVKLGKKADLSTSEDITLPKNFMVSEAMASKVCPVCKNFSSSSNTTLNAHIDQCLSGESTMKWAPSSSVIRYRVKPRKTRLMVDIYATAPYCTLEELERRNGRSWATNSSFQVQEAEFRSEEKVEKMSTISLEDTGREGAVYIDTDGTKVRILSKFNGVESGSKVGDDPGAQKLPKGDKGSNFLSTKKRKKLHGQKQQKFLKLAPHGKNSPSRKYFCNSEACGGQERKHTMEEKSEKAEQQTDRFKEDHKQIKLDDSGTIRRWARSMGTGLTKTTSGKDDHEYLGHNSRKDLEVETGQSSLGDSYLKRSYVLKTPNTSGNPISSPKSSKRTDISAYEPRGGECREQPPLGERKGFSSMESRVSGCGKGSLKLPKRKLKQLPREFTSMHDSCEDCPNRRDSIASSPSSKGVEMNAVPVKNSDTSAMRSEPSYSHHAFSSKARKLSSLRKNLSSVRQASVVESKFNFKKKCSALKKSRVQFISDLDEDEVVHPSKVDRRNDSMRDHTEEQSRMEQTSDEVSLGRSSFLRPQKKRGVIKIFRKEEASDLTNSLSVPQHYDLGAGETTDNFSFGACSASEATSDDEEFAREEVQTPGEHIVEGSFLSLSKSLDPEFHKLANSPDAEFDSQQGTEVYQERLCGTEGPRCPTERSLGDEQETFCSDEIGQNSHMVAELDSVDWQRNYFSDVDAIPIPGPPGSFLPSLEDLGSEDLQGNSSLTNSRVHSSEDHHDIVYRDSSDSLVSGTSTISNPSLARSDSRSSENLFVGGPHVVHDEIRPPIVENCAPVNLGADRMSSNDLKVNAIFPEKRSLGLKNDQACCCSRKEGASQGGAALIYQDSQLLSRWTMASVPPPPFGKQWGSSDPNKRLGTSNLRTEMFSLSNYPISSGSENAVLSSAMKSPAGPNIPMKVSVDSEVKFPMGGNCDSAIPSSSYPVLRLMGKNLMVVNKDEDLSLASNTLNGRLNSQHFNDRLSNNFISHVGTNTLLHASRVPSKTVGGGGFTATLERHKYEGGIQFAN